MDEHKQIDWQAIANNPNATGRRAIAANELERVGSDFMITDALSHKAEAGLFVMQVINGNIDGNPVKPTGGAAAAAGREYWLRVLMDKWGKPVKPGDKIEWLRGRSRRSHTTGKKITIREIKELERRGELRTIEDWGEATVNKYGCIVLAFHDAATLLDLRGVHHTSKRPLTGMKEKAGEATKCPDGANRLQHFWLYEEVPPWEVAEMAEKEE